MRVLLVHNYYREPGGEDYAFRAEVEGLRRAGHEVETLERSSAEETDSPAGIVTTALNTPWSRMSERLLEAHLKRFTPDIAHFHNTFPLVSPGAYYACRRAGVPVVQTLHNYRLLCARADLFRKGRTCEECVGRQLPTPAIIHRCYRSSILGSAAVAGMLALHHGLGTWTRAVDRYVVLTRFARAKFERGGLPADRLRVKANFLIDPPARREGDGEYALFVGRLSEEKGVRSLMRTWDAIGLPLHIVGGGPLEHEVRSWASTRPHVRVTGRVPSAEVHKAYSRARLLVFPSLWYEGFPITILESLAAGVPVLASHVGALSEIVDEARGGITFDPCGTSDLVDSVRRLWTDLDWNRRLSSLASTTFERFYDEESGVRALLALYSEVATPGEHQRSKAIKELPDASDGDHTSTMFNVVWVEGTPFAKLELEEAVQLISRWMREGLQRRVATANLDFLRLAACNQELATALRTADLVTADGTPVLWLSRLRGMPLHERVAGADLVPRLIAEAHRHERSVFLLGGAPGSAEAAASVLVERYPGLKLLGTASPRVELQDEESCRAAVAAVAAVKPDLLLVGFGCPKQELFLYRYLDQLECQVGIGVGATLDFLAGAVRRAPSALQSAGLEWAFRISQEPRRLGSRYARDFFFLVGAITRALSRAKPGQGAPR